jgi:cation:H+ antiporter
MATYILLVIGFGLLIKGADFLVDGASSIAKRLNVSDLVVGLTIVAFGTSTPELCVNIIASIKGTSEIAIGNVIGSNICNIFVILGISSVIFPLTVGKGTVWKEIPFTLFAAVLLGILANKQIVYKNTFAGLSCIDGLIFLALFIAFMYYVYKITKEKKNNTNDASKGKQFGLFKSILFVVLGLACLFLGAKWVVDGAVYLASSLGVSQSLIALTIVAAGTSLPELATSVVAAYKKNSDIAVGNIVGSNIFNIFLILGISSIIRPINFQPKSNIDIAVCILGSLLLFTFMFSGKKHSLDRWEGGLFIILYVIYMAFLIGRG